jgi:hypothetical protein
MTTALGSVKNSRLKVPPSRPHPESPNPPNGARRSRTKKQFTQIVPARNAASTRYARDRFSVKIMALSPKGVPLTVGTGSASESNGATVTTGPKISSRQIGASAGASTTTVGRTNHPSPSPPVSTFPAGFSRYPRTLR